VERELRLPATLSTSFQGTVQAFQRSLQGLGLLLWPRVLVIYLILGILYELHPPAHDPLRAAVSGGGSPLTLMLFNQELNSTASSGSSCWSAS
jgi:HAE1 family hydrophobic/amphiphilic exporter-1